MNLFYDPIKRKPQVWVIPVFIVIGLIFVVLGYQIGKNYAQNKGENTASESDADIFNR